MIELLKDKRGRIKAAVMLTAILLLILLVKFASSNAVYVSGNAGEKTVKVAA